MAHHRGVDEEEVWAWPVEKVLTWGLFYGKRDQELEEYMATMGAR